MLRIIRIIIAIISLVAVSLLFLDFTGFAVEQWGWMAKIQFIPALLSLNLVALAIVIGLTLLLGRIYCSVICPLGIFQDVITRIRIWCAPRRKRRTGLFRYASANTRTRLAVLGVFTVLLVLALSNLLAAAIAGLIAPYSAFGRIVTQIFAPVWRFVNNLLAGYSAADGSYMFDIAPVHAVVLPLTIVALLTLITVALFAALGGRAYCNTICPVGTVLGYLSKYSLFKIRIDTSKCVSCGKCGRFCKSSCIDVKNHQIDYTRCVACMDCIGRCSESAISYTFRRPKAPQGTDVRSVAKKGSPAVDKGRRAFMFAGGMAAGALAVKAAEKTVDGGLTPLKNKKAAEGKPIVPAGAASVASFSKHCTACQLCVNACPHGVLQPSSDFDNFMQPHMVFTDTFCRPDCTLCSTICPAGAINPVTVEEKSSIKIGNAVVDYSTCIAASAGKPCGSCMRHCPAGAISMVPVENETLGRKTLHPVVDETVCIGCGSCEYHCPVGTIEDMTSDCAAIRVVGAEIHQTI